jgi:hypothetical protein
LHRDAHGGVAKHRIKHCAEQRRGADDDQLLDRKQQAARLNHLVFERHRQHVSLGTDGRNHGDQAAQDVADADREHDDRELGLAQDGANDQPLDEEPKQPHGNDGGQNGQPIREAEHRHGGQTDEPTHHHEVALHEADRFCRLVDEHEAQCDQPVDATLGDAADDQL